MKCIICNKKFKSKGGLSKHLMQTHKLTNIELDKYYFDINNNIRKSQPEQYIQCKICGGYFKTLSTHLLTHNILSEDYLNIYGGKLISENTSQLHSINLKKIHLNRTEKERSIIGKKSAETVKKKYGKNLGGRKAGFKQTEKHKQQQQKRMLGKNNPFYGKKHTNEIKKKMSGPRSSIQGDKNPFKIKYDSNIEFKKKFKQTHRNLWKKRDINWRKQFGEKISKNMPPPSENAHKNHKTSHWLSSKCELGGFLRSSWEIFMASILDISVDVISYKIEPYKIEYNNKNDEKRYTIIDFEIQLTSKNILLCEVKPLAFITKSFYKIKGVECFCLENNLQFIIATDDCFFNKEKILTLLKKGNKNELRLDKYVRSGFNTPLQISTKFQKI